MFSTRVQLPLQYSCVRRSCGSWLGSGVQEMWCSWSPCCSILAMSMCTLTVHFFYNMATTRLQWTYCVYNRLHNAAIYNFVAQFVDWHVLLLAVLCRVYVILYGCCLLLHCCSSRLQLIIYAISRQSRTPLCTGWMRCHEVHWLSANGTEYYNERVLQAYMLATQHMLK